jgi:hypothetical protein
MVIDRFLLSRSSSKTSDSGGFRTSFLAALFLMVYSYCRSGVFGGSIGLPRAPASADEPSKPCDLPSRGPALAASSLCRAQEKRTIAQSQRLQIEILDKLTARENERCSGSRKAELSDKTKGLGQRAKLISGEHKLS